MELIIDRETIRLWPGDAPYTAESPAQRQPSLMPYPVEGARGAVVVLPGGGYAMKADHEGRAIAEMINAAGVAAYVLDYRVKPCHREAPLSDAKRAIRLVRSMGYEKVAILGFSAGGHLCCSAATLYDAGDPDAADPVERFSSRPDAFAPCYGATSLWHFRKNSWPDSLFGKGRWDLPTLSRWSAECLVTPDTPPAFIWHTADDPVVTVACALDLARALAAHGVAHELHVFPHGAHGLGLAGDTEDVCQWAPLCQKWLLSQGFGPAAPAEA